MSDGTPDRIPGTFHLSKNADVPAPVEAVLLNDASAFTSFGGRWYYHIHRMKKLADGTLAPAVAGGITSGKTLPGYVTGHPEVFHEVSTEGAELYTPSGSEDYTALKEDEKGQVESTVSESGVSEVEDVVSEEDAEVIDPVLKMDKVSLFNWKATKSVYATMTSDLFRMFNSALGEVMGMSSVRTALIDPMVNEMKHVPDRVNTALSNAGIRDYDEWRRKHEGTLKERRWRVRMDASNDGFKAGVNAQNRMMCTVLANRVAVERYKTTGVRMSDSEFEELTDRLESETDTDARRRILEEEGVETTDVDFEIYRKAVYKAASDVYSRIKEYEEGFKTKGYKPTDRRYIELQYLYMTHVYHYQGLMLGKEGADKWLKRYDPKGTLTSGEDVTFDPDRVDGGRASGVFSVKPEGI